MGERSVLDLVLRSKKTGSGGKEAEAELRGFSGAAREAATAAKTLALGGGAVVAAIAATVKIVDKAISPFVDYAHEVRELSMALGLSAEETSRVTQVADDFGISIDEVRQALEFATKQGFEPSVESLAELADELEGMNSPTEKAARLAQIFGRNWATLNPLLSAGGDALREKAAAIEESLILDEKAVAAARAYEIQTDNLADAWQGFTIAIGQEIVPALTVLLTAMQDATATGEVGAVQAESQVGHWMAFGRALRDASADAGAVEGSLRDVNEISSQDPGFDGWIAGLQGISGSAETAAGANLALVQSFSEVTAASLAATGLEELNAALEEGKITPEEYETAVRNLGGELLNLSAPQLEAILMQARFKRSTGETKDEVLREVEALKKLWEWLKKVGAGTTATSFTTPIHGAQHGMDLTVPQGFDRDNFLIGASSGERVKVTPPGGASQRTPAGGQVHIGQISVSVGPGANGRQIVDEMMAEISRRVRVASGSGAAFVGG
jgi:hypothetical protein